MNMSAYMEAISQWDTLAAEFGARWSYGVYRGRALMERGRYADAIESVETIVVEYESGTLADDGDRLDRTPPNLGEGLEVLAMACRGTGDLGRALEYIRRAVALEPANVSFLNNYGVLLAESGNIDGAKSQWNKVLSIDPDNAAVRKNLSAIEQ
jgi:tetratricopeptide (TPR) repeat protein